MINNFDDIKLYKKIINKNFYLVENRVRVRLKQRVGRYVAGFKCLMEKECSFGDAIKNLFPARFYKEKYEVRQKIEKYVLRKFNDTLKQYKFYNLNRVSLFGRPFYLSPAKLQLNSWFHTFKFINQVVIGDQYNAERFIKEDSVIIDAGGNIGSFAVLAANLAPKGHIYCFEPSPETFEVLKKNTAPYCNITIFQEALGEKGKTSDLIIDEIDSGLATLDESGMKISSSKVKVKVKVKVTTIDEFVKKNNISKIDFLKMDTEGYEKQIIEGAKLMIKKFSPVMVMSAYHHPEDKKVLPELIKSIDSNYRFKLDAEFEEDFVFYK